MSVVSEICPIEKIGKFFSSATEYSSNSKYKNYVKLLVSVSNQYRSYLRTTKSVTHRFEFIRNDVNKNVEKFVLFSDLIIIILQNGYYTNQLLDALSCILIYGSVKSMDNENTNDSNNESNVNYNNNNSDINNNDGSNDNNNNYNFNDQNTNTSNDNSNGNDNNNYNSGSNSDNNNSNENRDDQENDEDGSEINNNNDENNGSNNNNGNDNNDDENNNNSSVEEEDGDSDEDDENSEDDENINVNGHHIQSSVSVHCNDISNEDRETSIKTYLVNKLIFTDNEFEKSDSRLIVNNLSILSNTPYDSIEAQNKYSCNSHSEIQNYISFKVNDLDHNVDRMTFVKEDNNCVELINAKTSSLSDEFSGTESMEYIHYSDNDKSLKEKENWYTNLITITQDMPNEKHSDTKKDDAILESISSYNEAESSDKSEVYVITGNDTLSAVICLEEGLADDDSWVEELDRDDFPRDESSDNEENSFMEHEEEVRRFNRCEIDFTLHTIVEESGEESENENDHDRINPTELEKYFVFEIGGSESNAHNQDNDLDSVSESSSILSENLELMKSQETLKNEEDPSDLASSRLEKYFLSGFMGFNKRDSDGSVGSDSEGKHSPEQRRKKLVRARGTNRHNSLDNLNEEQQVGSLSQSENSSSDNECIEENTSFDKNDGQFDTVKRTKKKKRSLVMSSIDQLENSENLTVENKNTETEKTDGPIIGSQKAGDVSISNDLNVAKELNNTNMVDLPHEKNKPIKNILTSSPNDSLSRKDSFNNWSSDEETNLMMSKMRTFFKSMIANQRKNASPIIKNRNKPPQLVYFESELTRLMKTVPGLRDDQVKEIVEYLSSEDTWSDSYDSSDYTSSDLEVGTKNNPFQENISIDHCKVPDISQNGMKKDSDLVYHCLMSSFQRMDMTGTTSDSSVSRSSPPLMNKVMQHIGTRLVALMHEVSEGSTNTSKVGRYHRRMQPKLPTICTTTEEEDDSIEECSPLPRSKSYDPLLEESRQETSDNERFSWRGSFESALMTGSDSRTRLPSTGENSASALALAAAKRRSAGDLLFKSCNSSREQLDRVRSCGSIGGGIEDKIWSMRHARKRRSSVPDGASNSGESADGENDSDEDEDENQEKTTENLGKSTTLPRTLHTSNTTMTNSLPRLSSTMSPTPSIYKGNNSHQFTVKSARYRPPGYNCRTSAGNFATLCAPPRREYNRRRQPQQLITPSSVSVSTIGE